MPSRQWRAFSALFHLRVLTEVPSHVHQKNAFYRTLALSIAVSGLGLLLVLVLIFLLWYHDLLKLRRSKTSPDDGTAFKLHKFSYRTLKKATNSFSDTQKLGKGGFGIVYRGVLRNGKEVAVKRLDMLSFQGEREFQNELSICGGLHSPHVVKLLGYCTHGRRVRLLVYECMQNRSLQEALFEKGYPVHLDWEKRFKIILDIAKALAFLHLECNPPVIHGDVKPSNILLDADFSARIADFGLARLKTEDFWAESGRPSTSLEKSRRETPERLRFATPETVRPGRSEPYRPETADGEMWRKNGKSVVEDADQNITEGAQDGKKLTGGTQAVIDMATDQQITVGGPIDPNNCDSVSCSATPLQGSPQVLEPTGGPDDAPPNVVFCLPSPTTNGVLSENASQTKDSASFPAKSGTGAEEGDECCRTNPCEGGTTEGPFNIDRGTDSGLLPSTSKASSKKKVAGKDWWWRQENSGELSVKDYVMEWIGNELRGSGRSRSFKDEKHEEISPIENSQSRDKGEEGQKSKSTLSEIKVDVVEGVKTAEAKSRDKKAKPKCKKSREWWKDEYFAELSSKGKMSGKAKGGRKEKSRSVDRWKDYSCSAELGGSCSPGELRRITNRSVRERSGERRSKEWWREYHSGDLSFSREWRCRERRADSSAGGAGSEGWSGDRQQQQLMMSGEVAGRQWSGDLSRSGELIGARDASSTTSMRGTVCYVAPEYGGAGGGGSGVLSDRGDIYSFGVLVLVILSGRRPIQVTSASPMKDFERANLISWARSLAHAAGGGGGAGGGGNNLLAMVDEKLHDNYNREQAHLSILLALSCLQRSPSARPSIAHVLRILSGDSPAPSPSPSLLPLDLSPSPTLSSYRSPLRASSDCLPIGTP